MPGVVALLAATRAAHAEDAKRIAESDAIGQHAQVAEAASGISSLSYPLAFAYAALTVGVLVLARRRRWGDVAPGVVPDERRVPMCGLGFFALLVAQVFGAFAAVWLLGAASGPHDNRSRALVMLGGYAIQLPLAAALALALRGPPARTRRHLMVGIVGMALAWPLLQTAYVLAATAQLLVTGERPPSLGHETLEALASAEADPWAWLIRAFVVLVAPFVEEVAYRGALQGFLRGVGFRPWGAIALTSAVFVLMHMTSIPQGAMAGALAELFVLSLALGLIRERTRSLVPCVVAHALFNLANLVLAAVLATVPTP